jgi:hypothetical protein
MEIKKRCPRCMKPMREDGMTCQNPKCVKYMDDEAAKEYVKKKEETMFGMMPPMPE